MPENQIRMLHRQLQAFRGDLGRTMAEKAGIWASELVSNIRQACPYPTMASTFGLQHWNLPDGHVFIIGSSFYRPEAVWGVEHGRPPMYIYSSKGFPIHDPKTPPSGRMSPEAMRKYASEGVIIRKAAQLGQIPAKPFIVPTLLQGERRLIELLNLGIMEAIGRNKS